MSDQPLPSPGVGARRKGPKTIPKLDFSTLSPMSAASDKFPLAPSPSALHPQHVIDANVVVDDTSLQSWKAETEGAFGQKSGGLVVSLKSKPTDMQRIIDGLRSNTWGLSVIGVTVPFPLEKGSPATAPGFPTSSIPRVHLSTIITGNSDSHASGIAWAIKEGYVVDIHANVNEEESTWDDLEGVIGKAMDPQGELNGKVVIANVLPPAHTLSLPIVKLLSHPSYLAYQKHVAVLSLFPNVYVKFLPPSWGEPTPEVTPKDLSKEAKEWKRRIKMYLGPAVEAFGYQRIVFGSSPTLAAKTKSNAADWYELARESIAELGLEQEDIDAVFWKNARAVYAS